MRVKPVQLVPSDAAFRSAGPREPLFGLDAESLSRLLGGRRVPFRGTQFAEAIYRQWLTRFYEITTFPFLYAENWPRMAGKSAARPSPARSSQSMGLSAIWLILKILSKG